MDEVFVYSCPSCGGKVEYINNKWHCKYCNNTYEALFAQKSNDLPDIKNQKYEMYHYKCNKCNSTFVSLDFKNAKCNFCNEVADGAGEKFIASNIIGIDITLDMAKEQYKNQINKFSKELSDNFFTLNFTGKYLYCDLYNGCIKFTYKKIVEKYIFANLLIPNIKDDDYKFMYEIGNIGISHSSELSKFENKTDEIIHNGNYIIDIENINYENDIVNECIKVFAKKYNITDIQNIKIENNLEINEGTFVPVYINKVIDNNKEYNQYIIGNSSISKISKSPVFKNTKKDNAILNFPKKENAFKKYKIFRITSFILEKLIYISIPIITFMFILIIENGHRINSIDYSGDLSKIILVFGILIAIFSASIVFSFFFRKKRDYYNNSIKLTKEEYFNQIITNSNYVKVLKVEK